MCGESAVQIPNSGLNALTLARVTSQTNDARWQRPGESPDPIPGRPASARLVHPEDDLTPVGYPGEFGTTTVIPYQDPGQPGGTYHILDQQEPLPYAQPQPQPQAAAQHAAPEPANVDSDRDDERLRTVGRRGTQHLGLLILRVGLGGVLIAHGLQKLFGWGADRDCPDSRTHCPKSATSTPTSSPTSAPAARSSRARCWCWDCLRRWPRRVRWRS